MHDVFEEFNKHCKKKRTSLGWAFFNTVSYHLNKHDLLPTAKQPQALQIARLTKLMQKILKGEEDKESIYDMDLERIAPLGTEAEKILINLDYSEYFKNLIRNTCDETMQYLIANHWKDIEQLKNLPLQERKKFLQSVHELAIKNFQKQMVNHSDFSEQINPLTLDCIISDLNEGDIKHKIIEKFSKYAVFASTIASGRIGYYHRDDAKPAPMLSNIMHETVHAIELNLANIYYKNKDLIPPTLKRDARLMYLSITSDSGKGISFEHLYLLQHFERMAYEIDDRAQKHIKKKLQHLNDPTIEQCIIGKYNGTPPYEVNKILQAEP